MTLDEFLAWDDGTDRRYELWGGGVTAMAPPMPRHRLLAATLSREIGSVLRGVPLAECSAKPASRCPTATTPFMSPISPSSASRYGRRTG